MNIIDAAWERTTNENSIYITQVADFVREIEGILGISSFFTADELATLNKTAKSNPTVRVYKHRAMEFLLVMVNQKDFRIFLRDRFGIDVDTLDIKPQEGKKQTQNLAGSSNGYIQDQDYKGTPKSSTYGRKYDYNDKIEHDNTSKRAEDSALTKIIYLEAEIRDLKRQNAYLESKHNHKDYIRELDKREARIQQLERHLEKFKSSNKKLIEGINLQEQIVKRIQNQLEVGKRPNLKKLEEIFRSRNESVLNFIAIVFLAMVLFMLMVNILRFVLFLAKSPSSTSHPYIFPGDDEVSVSWWREIEWLEYFILGD